MAHESLFYLFLYLFFLSEKASLCPVKEHGLFSPCSKNIFNFQRKKNKVKIFIRCLFFLTKTVYSLVQTIKTVMAGRQKNRKTGVAMKGRYFRQGCCNSTEWGYAGFQDAETDMGQNQRRHFKLVNKSIKQQAIIKKSSKH